MGVCYARELIVPTARIIAPRDWYPLYETHPYRRAKNHGKTTLLEQLVEEFVRRGIAVGVIKHSKHIHELDTPGKDSHRLRVAGGCPVAVASADMVGVFFPRNESEDFYARLQSLYANCQIVLVEGHVDSTEPKLEVWRAEMGGECLARLRDDISGVISDDQPDVSVPVWPRSDIRQLADVISQMSGI